MIFMLIQIIRLKPKPELKSAWKMNSVFNFLIYLYQKLPINNF